MTKAVIITDMHLGCRGDSQIFLDYQDKFFKNIFFPFIDEHDIKTVINLGDTFDRRKFINYGTLKRAKEMYFAELQKRNIYSPTIIGNHDTYHKNSNKTNSIDLVLAEYHFSNIRPIVNEPKIISFDGVDVAMIPWICAENRDICLEFMKNCKTDLCMGHFPINGFVMHKGQVEETGFDKEIFDRFDMVFSGHFHHRSSNGKIYYLGNPYEITWQDYNDTKGFHVFDFETRKLEFVPNPYQMFHKIVYNDSKPLVDVKQYSNAYVKIVIEKKSSQMEFNAFMNAFDDESPFDINIVEDFRDVIEIEIDLDQSEDTPTLLEKYVDNMLVPETLNIKKLKGMLIEAYNQSLSIE